MLRRCALTVPRALVVRAGQTQAIDAADLVPGDRVVLEAGDKVPADLRLLGDGSVEADESLLTGESLVVSKSAHRVLPPETPVAERKTWPLLGR